MYHQFLANALAYRGHLHEAYAADRRLLLDPKASRFTWFMDPFLRLALLGVIPDSLAASNLWAGVRARQSVAHPSLQHPGAATARPPLVAGPKRHGVRWRGSRSGPSRRPGRRRAPRGKLRGRYLHAAATAYLALARGDSAGALRLFQSIPDTLCIVNDLLL